jgi:hypothetical protein
LQIQNCSCTVSTANEIKMILIWLHLRYITF